MSETNAVPQEAPQAPVEPVQDTLSPKFAALAKKEKWLRKMQEDINKERDGLKKREEEYKTNYVDKKRIKEDFLSVAMEAGLTPDQIANMLLNQPQTAAIDPIIREMREKIRSLEDEITQTKNGFTDNQKKQREEAIAQIRLDAGNLLQTDNEFETLKLRPDAADLITKYIEGTYDDEGVVISVKDAATFIENELLEQAVAFAKLKKVQEKAGLNQAVAEAETPAAPQKPQVQQQSQPPKTLTNGMTPPSKPLTARDRRERAILAFQGKL